MNDKIRLCTLEHSSQEHIRQNIFRRSWERSEQVQKRRRNYFECFCPGSSSYGVGTAIWDTDPDTANLVRYCNMFHSAWFRLIKLLNLNLARRNLRQFKNWQANVNIHSYRGLFSV